MAYFKKVGILLSSSVLSLGMLSSVASASSPIGDQPEKVRIEVASTDTTVTKSDLIKKFREVFPTQFDFLTANDFQMNNSHFYPDDDTLRHELSFSKTVNGKQIYGSLGFVGENLDIENYYYQPVNVSEALFPAKVSKEEARKIADEFIQQFSAGEDYQIEENSFNYYPTQLLTEPIRYSFSFVRMENKIPIADQRIEVAVLGNGEVVNFYRNPLKIGKSSFEDAAGIKSKSELEDKVKENLSTDLYYQIDTNYQTGEQSVQLVYQPTINLQGVHAPSGKWLTTDGYSADFPKAKKFELITADPLPAKKEGISLEEAKKIAEQLLASKSDKVKLSIESIDEVENDKGQAVISIHYMYRYANGGSGTVLEINKSTGEITQYNNVMSHVFEELAEESTKESALSEQEALDKAIQYLKEWVPSYLHNYAMPTTSLHFEKERGVYSISFPRVVNGTLVMGDDINVTIAADGALNSLYVNYQEVEEWPSTDKVISEETAKKSLTEALNLKLTYIDQGQNKDKPHYDLVYVPEFTEEAYSFLDASTGEWKSLLNGKNSTVVSHPSAQEELNYLIEANILDIKDSKDFDGDASVSKGEALKIIMNSLTYFYEGRYAVNKEEMKQTFTNIDTKHPSYQVIERAVELGIIKTNDQTFDVDSPMTREELATWYIRVLGLEQAAKDGSIYKLDFADANKVNSEYSGYVALANSLGLVKIEQDYINPDRSVTYAELAVSTIRLAHKIAESGRELQRY